ncbi:MAG TPA: hypothetical protein VGF85_12940 [Opitutaceae bacterium]|jgi:hippurate hydrolase
MTPPLLRSLVAAAALAAPAVRAGTPDGAVDRKLDADLPALLARRIARGEAIAAGLPDELMPTVTVIANESAAATYNDPALTKRVRAAVAGLLGPARVVDAEPLAGSEDFSQYGLTPEKVPLCYFVLGATAPDRLAESRRTGVPLPSLHSSKFYPVPEPAIRTGVSAFTAAALDLLKKT